MQDNKLSAAAALAFRRQQPKQLLIVLKKAQEVVQDTEVQESLVKNMSKDDLKYALQIVRDWNTQARSAHQAQCLLHTIMSQHSHEVSTAETRQNLLTRITISSFSKHCYFLSPHEFDIDRTLLSANHSLLI